MLKEKENGKEICLPCAVPRRGRPFTWRYWL